MSSAPRSALPRRSMRASWLACSRCLIHPRFVNSFVKSSKNAAVAAEAIHEAALRPTMRFVPVKTTEQQDLQMLAWNTRPAHYETKRTDESHSWPPGRVWRSHSGRCLSVRKEIRTAISEASQSILAKLTSTHSSPRSTKSALRSAKPMNGASAWQLFPASGR